MHYPTLYFGVELEFNIGYLHPNESLQDPTETRGAQFQPTEEAFQYITSIEKFKTQCRDLPELFASTYWRDNIVKLELMRKRIYDSIHDQLRAAKIPTKGRLYPTGWMVEPDGTIKDPPDTGGHRWVGVELISPPYEFNPKNIQEVKQYQFDSLHPQFRQGVLTGPMAYDYCKGMRKDSFMSTDHYARFSHPISAMAGLRHLDDTEDLETLTRAVSSRLGGDIVDRCMAYNTQSVWKSIDPESRIMIAKNKNTVEFRQHEGNIDGERVTQLITLLCKVIEFLKIVQQSSLLEMLSTVASAGSAEPWSETGDQKVDDANESNHGPIVAEGPFTIIDLLEHLGLQDSANFYRDRLHLVRGVRVDHPHTVDPASDSNSN